MSQIYTYTEGLDMTSAIVANSAAFPIVLEIIEIDPQVTAGDTTAFEVASGESLLIAVSTSQPPAAIDKVEWVVGETLQEASVVHIATEVSGATHTCIVYRVNNPTPGEGVARVTGESIFDMVVGLVSLANDGAIHDSGAGGTAGPQPSVSASCDSLADHLVVFFGAKRNDAEAILGQDLTTALFNENTTGVGATGACLIAGSEVAAADGEFTGTASFSPNRAGAAVILSVAPKPEPGAGAGGHVARIAAVMRGMGHI